VSIVEWRPVETQRQNFSSKPTTSREPAADGFTNVRLYGEVNTRAEQRRSRTATDGALTVGLLINDGNRTSRRISPPEI
jgi:hypothetical protein